MLLKNVIIYTATVNFKRLINKKNMGHQKGKRKNVNSGKNNKRSKKSWNTGICI